MVRAPSQRSNTISVCSAHSASTSRNSSNKIIRLRKLTATLHARRRQGHVKLELIDTKAHTGNNSGRVLDQCQEETPRTSISLAGDSFSSSLTRRELWQERTPTRREFPHIRLPGPRRRQAIRAKGSRVRRGLAVTFYSYCAAAKAPFLSSKRWRLRLDRARVRASMEIHKANVELKRRSMATIHISEPFSMAVAASRADLSPHRKNSLPFKSANPSPLGCHPPTILCEPVVAEDTSMPLEEQESAPEPEFKPQPEPISNPTKRQSRLAPPTLPHRNPSRHRKRDSFNRAKIHIRRPPKGVVHWFDAIGDVSDEEYSGRGDRSSQKSHRSISTVATFRPSLGPNRARAAPISRIGSGGPAPDYFTPRDGAIRRKLNGSRSPSSHRRRQRDSQFVETNPLRHIAERNNGGDASSDDEDSKTLRRWSGRYWDMSTPSPGAIGQVFLRRAASHRKASVNYHAARQSVNSAQTNMTSASLPFMLRTTCEGAPPLPDTPPATTPDCLPLSYFALTGRLPGSSGATSPAFDAHHSGVPSSDGARGITGGFMFTTPPVSAASRLMAVTEEEMALLEAMRRKRSEVQEQRHSQANQSVMSAQSALSSPMRHVPQLVPLPLRPAKRQGSSGSPANPARFEPSASSEERKASTSTTITLEDGENIGFPTPPMTADSRPCSRKRGMSRSASIDQPPSANILDVQDLEKAAVITPQKEEFCAARQGSYWSPEIATPGTDFVELEGNSFGGPFIRPSTASRPGTSASTRLRGLFENRTAMPTASANDDLAESDGIGQFSIEFGDLHLLPLCNPGHRKSSALHIRGLDRHQDEIEMNNDLSSPGLTDGDSSSCGRQSRNEIETPIKNCTFTASNAFDIVDSDADDDEDNRRGYNAMLLHSPDSNSSLRFRRYGAPLLGKVDKMYAFAEDTSSRGDVLNIALDTPDRRERFYSRSSATISALGLGDADERSSGQIEIGVLNAFHSPSGYTAVR